MEDSPYVDMLRRGYELFNRGDIEPALEQLTTDVEWQTYLVPGPGGGLYRGHGEVHQLWTDVHNVFADFRNEPERFFEQGDFVVAFVRFTGRGRNSGARVEASLAHVFTLRGDKVALVRTYEDRDEALRAAGFSAGA